MKKGLTLTLMTVAIAMLGIQAMAYAPVIGDIPSPIIGGSAASGATAFVYPEAINLTTYVTDPGTTLSTLMWSYSTSAASSNYAINGVGPIATSGATNGTAMTPGNLQINLGLKNGETKGDASNPNDITIRNVTYAPLSGSGGANPGSLTGIQATQTEEITFYASDGTTYGTSKPVYFYTDLTGADRISVSQTAGQPTPVFTPPPFSSTQSNGFVGGVTNSGGSAATHDSMSATANGLCFTVPSRSNSGTGANSVTNTLSYTSAQGIIPIVANAVYRIRVTLNGSQTAVGSTPFWDLNLQNPQVTVGGVGTVANMYGADMYILDNEGGANSVISSTNGQTFDFWWTPAAVSTPQWNDATNGAFAPNYAGSLTTVLQFRMLDTDANPGIQAWLKSGTICLSQMAIDRWDLGSIVKPTTPDWIIDSGTGKTGFVQNTTGNGNFQLNNAYATATVSYSNGALVVAPPAGTTGASLQVTNIWPGKDTLVGTQTYSNTPADNAIIQEAYPVPWKSNTLYQITINLAANSAADASQMPDAYFLGMSTASNEANYQSMITSIGFWPSGGNRQNVGPGAPTTTASTYMAFYYGQHQSAGSVQYNIPGSVFDWLQPFLQIVNTNAVQGNGANTGKTVISQFAVYEVTFPGM